MGILRVIIDRNLPCRTMVRTCASEAASFLAARQRPHRVPLQEAQDPEFELEVMMEDVGSDDIAGDRPVPAVSIKEASTTKDEEDADLVMYQK
jgi:hypothetical protein